MRRPGPRWAAIFFVASAAASSAYLTVSEIFPLEMRAISISLFYAVGTGVGGFVGPALFGALIESRQPRCPVRRLRLRGCADVRAARSRPGSAWTRSEVPRRDRTAAQRGRAGHTAMNPTKTDSADTSDRRLALDQTGYRRRANVPALQVSK